MNPWLRFKNVIKPAPRAGRGAGSLSDSPLDTPATLIPLAEDPAIARTRAFDPALKHFPNGFRHGEPGFTDPDVAQRWLAARRSALDHALSTVARSEWAEHLVVRGSVVLRAWLGDQAREPGDLDFVVLPDDQAADAPESIEMLRSLTTAIGGARPKSGVLVSVEQVAVDSIWTYERAEGRRLVFPWSQEGVPPGSIQLDFVFRESLLVAPVRTTIPLVDGGTEVATASMALSLAWKLLWLVSDSYPQGKDLYDATLLAERCTVSFGLLQSVLHVAFRGADQPKLTLDFLLGWNADWAEFKREYPWVEGDLESWRARLARALAPTFEASGR